MAESVKLHEQLNEWRDDRRQMVGPQRSSRTVRVKGHEVMVTYRRRPGTRPTLGGGGRRS